jgi:hypothetical protein
MWKKAMKRYANRKIRMISVYDDLADGMSYKRYIDQYDLCDWKFKWDPTPRIYWVDGEMRLTEPEPWYKAGRK